MKKLLAIILAAVTTMSLAVPAFAASTVNPELDLTQFTCAPFDEDGKQLNNDEIAPGQTIYYLLPQNAANVLNSTKNFKISTKKNKNAKQIGTVSLVEKKLTSDLSTVYKIPNGKTDGSYDIARTGNRNTYIAVEVKDSTTVEELKIEMDVVFTARKTTSAATGYNFQYGTASSNAYALPVSNVPTKTGDKITFTLAFWVSNKQISGDSDITVTPKGITVKPLKNEENILYFESNDSDSLATLTFKASSNPKKFLAKLSTKWSSDLLRKFQDSDAVMFNFTPVTLDCSNRATLSLDNPYDDDDFNAEKIYIYSVSGGALTDVSSSFTYNEDEDTFETLTRTLGMYIISNGKASSK